MYHPLLAQFLEDPSTRWALLGAGVAAVAYVTFIRPLRNKKKKDPLDRTPRPSSLAQQRSVEREMNNLLLELSEMARHMTAQLDTRSAKLELLIKEADEKIAALKAAGVTAAETPRIAPPADRNFELPSTPAADPRHAVVYQLADQGHSPRQIAQELGRPNGEIELILALRGEG